MAKFSSPRQFGGPGDWREALRSNWAYLTAWLNSVGKRTVVQLDSAETIATATTTAIPWDSLRGDDELRAWDSAVPTRLTAIAPGRYLFLASVAWATDSAGYRFVSLNRNGSGTADWADRRPAFSGGTAQMQAISYPVDMSVGEYYEAKVHQTSGVSLNVNSTDSTSFAMWRIA